MTLSLFQKTALSVAGVTAMTVGGFILAAPQAFYASYGVELGGNVNLLSELRAPAANLLALGLVMLAGVLRDAWVSVSVAVAMVVFLAFPLGRIVSLAVDGIPSQSILGALVIELVIAGLLIVAFRRRKGAAIPAE